MSREDWFMDSTVTIRLPSAMLAYLQKYTVDGGLSLSEAIRRIIGQHQIVVDRSDGRDIFQLGPFGEAPTCPKCGSAPCDWSYAQLRWKGVCKSCGGRPAKAKQKLSRDELSNPPPCECGCGMPRRLNRSGTGWLLYHDASVCSPRKIRHDIDMRIASGDFGDPPLCECGCGGSVGFNYSQGHWNKRIRNHNKGRFDDERIWRKALATRISKGWERAHRYAHTEKHRRASLPVIRNAAVKTSDDLPFCMCGCGERVNNAKAKYLPNHYQKKQAEEAREARGEAPACRCGCEKKVKWNTRQKRWNTYYGKHATRDPEYRLRMSQSMNAEHKRAELILKGAANYRNPEYIAKINRRPNGLESLFGSLAPDDVKYVGGGDVWIQLPNGRSKNPDFLVGEKKVIELYGDYWHRDDDADEMVELYRQAGYDCLVIWESEFNDLESVLDRVANFLGNAEWQMSLNLEVT